MADKKKEYLIGDVSRIVGLSRDALRFYEKKGVIRANKKENGYRYFSDEDIYRLMCIVYRRKMNDSLEEIRESVKDNRSVAGMRRHLEQRIKEEEEEILRRRQSIARMSLSLKDMDCIEDCMGKYSLKKFPQAYIWIPARIYMMGCASGFPCPPRSAPGYGIFLQYVLCGT